MISLLHNYNVWTFLNNIKLQSPCARLATGLYVAYGFTLSYQTQVPSSFQLEFEKGGGGNVRDVSKQKYTVILVKFHCSILVQVHPKS